ncbi:MAG: class I SAM-dependent methyltransferase [Planctomycetota bacterium]|nr:class I SAM-dependent methyltransferase [Planctomycetota bacterium]
MDPKLLSRYQSSSGAAAYRRKYERSWIRRLSNRRELSIVDKALERAGTHGRVLDCPCGAGRLTPTILRHAEKVVCADISAPMVAEAREALAPFEQAGVVSFAVAPASELPMEDDTFDTAVCHRLIHHMAEAEERAGVLAEMARVASRRVVISFSDDSTWKGRSQRRRGVHRRRSALMPDDLMAEAAPHGLKPLGKPLRLNGFHSLVAIAVFEVGQSTS